MTNLGFTVNAVEQVLARSECVAIYQSALGLHMDNLKQSEMSSFESYFKDNILFALSQDPNVHSGGEKYERKSASGCTYLS